jgi:adhesin transport system outer membrane protein
MMKINQLARMTVLFVLLATQTVTGETLGEAVSEALASHPSVLGGRDRLRSIDEAVSRAVGDYLPTLDLRGVVGRERSFEKNTDGSDVSLTRSELSLVFNQNLFAGFSSESELERERARRLAANYALQSVEQDVALRTAAVYYDVLRYGEILDFAEEFVAAQRVIFSLVEKRFESGVGNKADLEQVRVRLAYSESNRFAAQNNQLDSLSRYKAVLGHLPGKLERPKLEVGLPDNLKGAIEKAFANHPTLKSANADIVQARAQRKNAESPFYPRVDFELRARWDEDKDGLDQKDHDLLGQFKIQYNLFNGTKDLYQKRATAHLVNVAMDIRDQTRREVEESLRLSWRAYEMLSGQIPYLRQRVKASEATYKAYTQQFKVGRRTLFVLLDARGELFESRVDRTNAEYDHRYAKQRVLHSLGTLVSYFKSASEQESPGQFFREPEVS